MTVDMSRVCFVGLDASAPCYYRVMLPAMELGADWTGVIGFPPNIRWVTGGVKGESQLPNLVEDYDIVVIQQPKGDSWEALIKAVQATGAKVIFEIDDYVHGVPDVEHHDFAAAFDKRALMLYERCMRASDAIIASTEYIAKKYKKFNPNVFVCRNGLDLRRYALGKPERPTLNIGWAGSTGHQKMMMPWLNHVAHVMEARPEVNFVSIGAPFATALQPKFGEQRAIAIPWAAIEQYPAAMTMFDVALAPGGGNSWFKGKSDLRWLEASALGIPVIGRPSVYREMEDGVTGFHATGPHELVEPLNRLLSEPELRQEIGAAAKAYVTEHRSIGAVAEDWREALAAVAGL